MANEGPNDPSVSRMAMAGPRTHESLDDQLTNLSRVWSKCLTDECLTEV